MADTAIAITAGVGTNVDTRTEGTNGNHRQVVVIGDPATNAGVAPVDATAGLKVDLGADNDVTVTGTVTANLSTTDNDVLDTIETNTDFGAVVGGGVQATALRVTVASDSTGVLSVDDGGSSLSVDNPVLTNLGAAISGSEVQVDVVAALPAGTNAIGKLAANSGVDIGDVDILSIAAGANLIGDVSLQPRTTGGLTIFSDVDLDEAAIAVKASAGQIYHIHAINLDATPLYLQLFNVAQGSVTVGTTTPTAVYGIPSQGDANGAGFTIAIPQGLAFATAITAAVTTTPTGATGPGANECVVMIGYK